MEMESVQPGLKVKTEHGICTLLHPQMPGKREGNWTAVLDNGHGIVVTQEDIHGSCDSSQREM